MTGFYLKLTPMGTLECPYPISKKVISKSVIVIFGDSPSEGKILYHRTFAKIVGKTQLNRT